ncbi:MAG: hypothetical protein DHS20C01_24770 [marine bacterium B5-7]|nr:MAG: hypothetical protein DHS20C01_24770 [marine bacterium B5-7]
MGVSILQVVLKVGGLTVLRVVLIPVALYYLVTHRIARNASFDYLDHLNRYCAKHNLKCALNKGWLSSYRHIYSFALSMAEKYAAWCGDYEPIALQDVNEVDKLLKDLPSNRGAVLVVSHLGNFDLAMTAGVSKTDRTYHILIDHFGTRRFNSERFAAMQNDRLFFYDTDNFGIDSAMQLYQAMDDGDVVVIPVDRIGGKRNAAVDIRFLDGQIHLPTGPWIMAHVLKCPVVAVFICREKEKYRVITRRLSDGLGFGDRRSRNKNLQEIVQSYAHFMEEVVVEYPEQWYNFYKYWQGEN